MRVHYPTPTRLPCMLQSLKPGDVFMLAVPFIVTDKAATNGMYPVVSLTDGRLTEFEGRLLVHKVHVEVTITPV